MKLCATAFLITSFFVAALASNLFIYENPEEHVSALMHEAQMIQSPDSLRALQDMAVQLLSTASDQDEHVLYQQLWSDIRNRMVQVDAILFSDQIQQLIYDCDQLHLDQVDCKLHAALFIRQAGVFISYLKTVDSFLVLQLQRQVNLLRDICKLPNASEDD